MSRDCNEKKHIPLTRASMLQLWSITDDSAIYAASPALYYATFFELVDATEAEHGPWPLADFDVKVVRS